MGQSGLLYTTQPKHQHSKDAIPDCHSDRLIDTEVEEEVDGGVHSGHQDKSCHSRPAQADPFPGQIAWGDHGGEPNGVCRGEPHRLRHDEAMPGADLGECAQGA